MHDLRSDLGAVERAVGRLPAMGGSRVICFLSANGGAGTTSAAVSFALLAEKRAARSVWLVDLDFRGNRAAEAFQSPPFDEIGPLSRPYDGALNCPPPYALSPESDLEATARGSDKLLTVHQVGERRLLVTRFRGERLPPEERVRLRDSAAWWSAVRRAADWIIVDAPALDKSGDGLAIAAYVDAYVLVLNGPDTTAGDAMVLRQEIERQSGRVIGAVLNRTGALGRFLSPERR